MPQRLLAVILIAYAILASAYNLANPLFESPDELLHYDIVRYVQRRRALPVTELDAPLSEYHQAPLYYALGALATAWVPTDDYAQHVLRNPFWAYRIGEVGRDNKNQFLHGPQQAFPYQGTALAVHLVRLLSTLAGIVAIIWTYYFALQVMPGRHRLALAAAAVAAFTPNFLLTTTSVTNDSFVSAAPVGIMLYILKLAGGRAVPTSRQWLTLGVLLGVAVLIKVSALPLMVVAALLATLLAWQRRSWPLFLRTGLCLLGPVLLITGWWFVRNLVLYHDLTGMGPMWRTWGTRPPLTAGQLWIDAYNFFTTYWANFGYGNVPVPDWVYMVLVVLCAAAALGCLGHARQYWRERSAHAPVSLQNMLIAAWLAITFAALFWYLSRTISVTGRQIYAILPALATYFVWGLARWIPTRVHTAFAGVVGTGMLVLGGGALIGVLHPAYQPAPRLSLAEAERVIPNRTDWRVGDVARLIGYAVAPEAVQLGDDVHVTLYWQVLRAPERNYTVAVRLLGIDNAVVGGRNTYPGLGNDPTLYWQPGDILVDTIGVPVHEPVSGPLRLTISAGLFDLETGASLPVMDATGRPAALATVGHVKLAATYAAPTRQTPLNVAFADGLQLSAFDLFPTRVPPGREVTLTLFWSPAGPLPDDYTIFVHVIDRRGNIVAQADGPPRGGSYPTTTWQAGEVVADARSVFIPAQLRAGTYPLEVGLYRPDDGMRWPLADGTDYVRLPRGVVVFFLPEVIEAKHTCPPVSCWP